MVVSIRLCKHNSTKAKKTQVYAHRVFGCPLILILCFTVGIMPNTRTPLAADHRDPRR